jgi:hypothetical protein
MYQFLVQIRVAHKSVYVFPRQDVGLSIMDIVALELWLAWYNILYLAAPEQFLVGVV